MSDVPAPIRLNFLGRLVDEAFGVGPALQPRKQSFFEPAPVARFADEPQSDAPFQQRREDAAEPMASIPRASARELHESNQDRALVASPDKTAIAEPLGFEIRARALVDVEGPRPDGAPPPRRADLSAQVPVSQPAERMASPRGVEIRAPAPRTSLVEPPSPPRVEPQMPAPSLVSAIPAPVVAPPIAFARASMQAAAEAPALVPMPSRSAEPPIVERMSGPLHSVAQAGPQVQPRRLDATWDVASGRAEFDREFRTETPTAAALLAGPIARDVVPQGLAENDRAATAPLAAQVPLQSSPVVNVTIGRVEVRAAPVPAATRGTERRGQGPLSLDDYLKRRGGQ